MLVSAVMSAFLSNTGTAACLLPIIMAISRKSGVSLKKLLIPMAFATSLGGTLTLIGTPPNGIVQSTYESMGGKTFGFFEYSKVGIFVFVGGMLFLSTFGRRLLSGRERSEKEKEAPAATCPEKETRPDKDKAPIAITVFLLVVFFMAMDPVWQRLFPPLAGYFSSIPLTAYAVLGVVVLIATKVMTAEKAFRAVNWTTIFLFAGMLSLKPALINTGAADFIANGMIGATESLHLNPNYAVLAALVLVSVLVTNFMSNTATAALLAPVAMETGILLGCDPAPLLMGVALACSACFLTPVATPPNTLVLGPGGYSFRDYLRAGWLLQLIVVVILVLLVPVFFPF
jgi:anion transporter